MSESLTLQSFADGIPSELPDEFEISWEAFEMGAMRLTNLELALEIEREMKARGYRGYFYEHPESARHCIKFVKQ